MKRSVQIAVAFVVVLAVVPRATFGEVIEDGDLNIIIDEPGNASNGLRYLDMTYSDGLGLTAALANAQATYSNARLATPDEWDDLFAASAITYTGGLTASDAFATGSSILLSSGTSFDGGVLAAKLGYTVWDETHIWSSPDGSGVLGTTRDYLTMRSGTLQIRQTSRQPEHGELGWLLVSEVAPVPEPSTYAGLLGITCVSLLAYGWRRKRQQAA